MKTIPRFRYVPLSLLALTTASGVAVDGCTTTQVNGVDGGASSSSGSGSSSGNASSSGSGSSGASTSSGSGSGGNSGSSGSSSGGGDAGSSGGDGAVVAPTCSAMAPAGDGGASLITDFSKLCTGPDGGVQYNACFGTYPGFYGGTYFFPGINGQPLANAMDVDAGGCFQPQSMNSFVATAMPASKSWALSGTVAGYSGVGIYLQSSPNMCVNASAYSGVRFTLSGTIGSAGDAGATEAGASDAAANANSIQFKVFESTDLAVSTMAGSAGTCTGTCTPPSLAIPLQTAPTVVTVHWTDLIGGAPDPSITDPAHLTGIEWDLPWPCTGGTPYSVNITVQNVEFIQ
jgi:hypothetical protein